MRECRYCQSEIPSQMSRLAKFCSGKCRSASHYISNRGPLRTALTVTERFNSYLTPPNANGCVEWGGARFGPDSYGAFYVNGKTIGAHRYAYQMAHGSIPDNMLIQHRCDNPPCVNPDHLEAGTPATNGLDAMNRRRVRAGVYSHKAKLTDNEVEQIRSTYAQGQAKQRELGRTYGVSQAAISLIIRGINRKRQSAPPVTTPTTVHFTYTQDHK